MARALNRTVLAGGVIYSAGTAESEVKGEVPDEFWDGGSDTTDGYASQTVDELEAEAARRSLEVTGTGKDGNVLKKDLVAALEADDKA